MGMRFFFRVQLAGIVVALCAAALLAGEPVPEDRYPAVVSDRAIEALLAPIRDQHDVPGLIAAVVKPKGLASAGAVGVRKLGSPEPMTVNDRIHLGSNTKAMTATQLALLVEAGKLAWRTTLGEAFPDLKPQFHEQYAQVTIEQLLTHRAGLPANAPYFQFQEGSLTEQREAILRSVLAKPPEYAPGTKFAYSNVGYIIAGHVAEKLTGKPWEELIAAALFKPLEMSSPGFGFPGTAGKVDEPWGHQSVLGLRIARQMDNPAVMGPAGTVHCSFADWAKFVSLHLRAGRSGPNLLKPETFDVLHTPPAGEHYAMGWAVTKHSYADGPWLEHSGSNTLWMATVAISRKHDVAFLVAANIGGESGQKACDAALGALATFYFERNAE